MIAYNNKIEQTGDQVIYQLTSKQTFFFLIVVNN